VVRTPDEFLILLRGRKPTETTVYDLVISRKNSLILVVNASDMPAMLERFRLIKLMSKQI
jgi:hypothetical protein